MRTIFITPELNNNEFGEIQSSVRENYFKYFENLNFYCNSNFTLKKKIIEEIAKKSHALILSGGGDIYKYNKKKINLLRDIFEKKLLSEFKKRKKPVIAICRGFQLIADLEKSKLVKVTNHVRKNHHVKIIKKNKFVNFNYLNTNSYHNLIVKKINGNFQTNAITADGSIEIATNLRKKILCLMFHPERKNSSKIKIDKLIKSFLNGSTDISSR